MATARGIEAGRAFIRIIADNTQAFRSLRRMERRFQKFGDRIQKIAGAVAGAFAGQMAVRGVFGLASIAGDIEIIERRFDLLFRNVADAAEASARKFSEEYSTALFRVRDQFVRTRALLTPLALAGASEKQLLRLTESTAMIIQDFSVMAGISMEESQARITSALTSTGEAVDQYGINVRAAALESELLAMGIEKTVQQATEEEKLLAKLSIIRRALNNQQIRAADSLGLYNVQVSRLLDNVRALAGEIGSGLLPLFTQLATAINKTLQPITNFLDAHPMLAGLLASAAVGIGSIVALMGAISLLAGAIVLLVPAIMAMMLFPPLAAAVLGTGLTLAAETARTALFDAATRPRREFEDTQAWRAVPGWDPEGQYPSMLEEWAAAIGLRAQKFVPVRETVEDRIGEAAEISLTAGGFTGPALERSLAFGGAGASIEVQQLERLENIEGHLRRIEEGGQ